MEGLPYKKLKLTSNTNYLKSSEAKVFNFNVQLHSTKTKLAENREIKFVSPPQDILAVKKQVEKQFSIPACVQTVSFNGHTLKNDIKLSDLRVRNGDMFHVEYLAKGDCADLMEIISWLDQLSNAMVHEYSDLNDIAENGLQQKFLRNLPTIFFSWEDTTSRSYVNKLFFADNDGVNMILKVYKFLLQKTWNVMDISFKCFESWILASLFCFTETFPLCRLLIQHNIIEMLTQSLLRVKLEEGWSIHDYDTSGDHFQQSLLVHIICCSVGLLAK